MLVNMRIYEYNTSVAIKKLFSEAELPIILMLKSENMFDKD